MKKFEEFYNSVGEEFSEYISEVQKVLECLSTKYANAQEKISAIKEKNERIECLYSGEFKELTKEDEDELLEIIELQDVMKNLEMKAMFFVGCKEMFLFLRKMDIVNVQENGLFYEILKRKKERKIL